MADAIRHAAVGIDRDRRASLVRSPRGLRLAVAAVAGSGALLATLPWKAPALFVWNASASAPIGLYRVHSRGPLRPGDMVVARAPEPARALAARRGYLPATVPLVKRIAAVSASVICAAGNRISIDGRLAAVRRRLDSAGRPMPWWTGCRRLAPGQLFLLMDSPASFDGRYFGMTGKDDVLGRAVLVWQP